MLTLVSVCLRSQLLAFNRGGERLQWYLAAEEYKRKAAVLRVREVDGNTSHLIAAREGMLYDSSRAGMAQPVPATAEAFAAMGFIGIVQMWTLAVDIQPTTTDKRRLKLKEKRRKRRMIERQRPSFWVD